MRKISLLMLVILMIIPVITIAQDNDPGMLSLDRIYSIEKEF